MNKITFVCLRTSGNSFVSFVQIIVNRSKYSFSFVDDLSICYDNWTQQYKSCLRAFLTELRKSGLTLNVKKCWLAKPEVTFTGHVIGSGRHRPDEQKLVTITITDISRPITKRDIGECSVSSYIFDPTSRMWPI